METNTSILIVGNPGPSGDQILARRDVEALWATSAEEASAILEQETPRICLISPSLGKQGARRTLEVVNDHHAIPCILLVGKNEPPVDSRVASRSVAVVPIDQCESILGLVGQYTSLKFARHARVQFAAPVHAQVFGEEHVIESVNIAESGIALKGLPPVVEGTVVRLRIELRDLPPINAVARVVRFASDGLAGLEFIDLPAEERHKIAKIVEQRVARTHQGRLKLEDLFTADISTSQAVNEALTTKDLFAPESPTRENDRVFEQRALIRGMMLGDLKAASSAPAWLSRVAREITAIEGDSVMGTDTPAWVHEALDMRIRLGERRAEREKHPETREAAQLSQKLGLDAYRLFIQLAEVARREPSHVVAQIAKLRAAILRDLLSAQPRDRSGAAPLNAPTEPLEVLESTEAAPFLPEERSRFTEAGAPSK